MFYGDLATRDYHIGTSHQGMDNLFGQIHRVLNADYLGVYHTNNPHRGTKATNIPGISHIPTFDHFCTSV